MPRRPAGAVRAEQLSTGGCSQIDGLSAKTIAAIARFEQRRRWPGGVADALRTYRWFLRRPGRWLRLTPTDRDPCCDPMVARDLLEAALQALPRRGQAELRRLIEPLDADFYRRTIPDPFWRPPYGPYADRWWNHRMVEV
jgi:hypothetical protein